MAQGTLGRAALTAQEAAALSGAFQALQRGDVGAALAIAHKIAAAAPASPDALHLLALCLRDSGDLDGAAQAFSRALAAAPRHADMLNNFGSLLLRQGKAGEAVARYKAAIAIAPTRENFWMNLSLAQSALGAHHDALASAAHAATLAPNDARVLRALAAAQRESGDLDGSEASLRKSLTLDPQNGQAWTSLGIVRRLIGDPEDSLLCYAKARATGYNAPELADAEASAHLDLGDFAKALAAAKTLTQIAPAYVAGHVLAAHIQWEYGVGDANDPLASLEHAASSQPQNHELSVALINALLEAERAEEALAHIRRARAVQDGPALAVAHAGALHLLGDIDGATAVLEAAAPTLGASAPFSVAFARQLIRAKRPDAAAQRALFAAQKDPLNQEAWAMLSTAWRMLDDPREQWLCDYERFVLVDDVAPPAGYVTQAAFIEALSAKLSAMHSSQHAPLNQSLRGGTQTSGSLFGRRDPVIAAARDALRASIERMIAKLPDDPGHPFLGRRARSVRFSGSWSVRLRSAGRHVNHYHPRGWLSSAFYIELPPSVARADAAHAGWIQFGQPPLQYETGLEPRRVEQPKIGRLVLFPSYMWHGTVPFSDDAHRMTIAFDALPAA